MTISTLRHLAVLIVAHLAALSVSSVLTHTRASAQRPARGMEIGEAARHRPRVALVIGNAAYETSPLKNPANDAYDVAAALRTLGFDATLGQNWSKRQMEDAIYAFGQQLKKGGVGLFYFSGHGMQVRGKNYLLPIGCRVVDERDVEFEAVDADRVLGKMDAAANGMNLMILDACRDNPFARSFRTESQGLAQMDAPAGTYIAYATAPGSVAADGEGRNGTYTEALLKEMQVPGLKVEEVFKRVRSDVSRATVGKQLPWDASSLVGDFYFAGGDSALAPNPERPVMERPTLRPRKDATVVPVPGAQPLVVQGEVFTYELVRCRRSGPTVQCDLFVTNRFQDRRMYFYPEDCVAFDENGATFRVWEAWVANREAGSYDGHLMLTGVRTRVVLRFASVPQESREFKLVRIVKSADGFPDRTAVDFREVQIGT